VWGGEFGRTPVSESGDGRDHNPYGFSMFMAGGGVKGGMTYGATDEFGFKAVETGCRSTISTPRSSINSASITRSSPTATPAATFRLTDVFGTVVKDILI
jgi:chorismate synthase